MDRGSCCGSGSGRFSIYILIGVKWLNVDLSVRFYNIILIGLLVLNLFIFEFKIFIYFIKIDV